MPYLVLDSHKQPCYDQCPYNYNNKVFIKRKIWSVDTILRTNMLMQHTHIHTQAPAQLSILPIQNLIYMHIQSFKLYGFEVICDENS